MEQCEPLARTEHPWKAATVKRRAWARSRDSWQAPESQDDSTEGPLPTQPMEEKPSPASEPGPIPNKIASWLRDCRTPLGASLDEQSNSPTKGLGRNGCSFEDDLSLGAEANHLQPSSEKAEVPGYGLPAKDRRSQFKQKGRSMNSTGSGKSSATVSSVSELLDLYEEDPEEILYNLGFGREEPDIASKIPSRFFNSSSSAKGIDIKVYLGAQIQRMELENPNYALTSRFRQTEVLATVANVFTEIYSQVSGRPTQRIGSCEGESKEPSQLKRNNSALNAAKILKKTITRQNLLSSTEGAQSPSSVTSDPGKGEAVSPGVWDSPSESEHKQQRMFRKKDSPSLATVTEESQQGSADNPLNGDAATGQGVESSSSTPFVGSEQSPLNGEQLPERSSASVQALGREVPEAPVLVSISGASEEGDMSMTSDADVGRGESHQKAVTSTPDKETPNLLPNPHIAHLLSQPRDSFEMEELQSNEDDAPPGTRCTSRASSEHLLRTGSQQSDSSGFAEDPSTDGSANYLKVQESSDSCDSETTVTSHAGDVSTPVALEHLTFERSQGLDLFPQSGRGSSSQAQEDRNIPEYFCHPRQVTSMTQNLPSACLDESALASELHGSSETSAGGEPAALVEPDVSADVGAIGESTVPEPSVEAVLTSDAINSMEPVSTEVQGCTKEPDSLTEPETNLERDDTVQHESPSGAPESEQSGPSPSDRVRVALQRVQQRSSSTSEDGTGEVRVKARDSLRDRNPLRRSSSLPSSLLSPSRVVSSVRIQLGRGSVKHCTPPSYAYRFGPEEDQPLLNREEVDSIVEEDEEEPQSSCRSTLIIRSAPGEGEIPPESRGAEEPPRGGVPPYPLCLPRYLTHSSSSLYSAPQDWAPRPLGEAPSWSTCSVPNLPQHTSMAYSPTPPHASVHYPYHRGAYGSPYSQSPGPIHSPLAQVHSAPPGQLHNSPFAQPPHGPIYTAPHPGLPFNHLHNTHFSSPYHPQLSAAHSGSLSNLQGSPYSPHTPLCHTHSAPCSFAYNSPANLPPVPCGHTYAPQCSGVPAHPFPCDPAPPPPLNSTEMQLRRVLHDIRGTVQSLEQGFCVHGDDTPSGMRSPQQPVYEELQKRRKSLNVFRSQMMDLELALMRQQSMVYQHLTPEERQEAEHLQQLRAAVRQELQELELQLEDRLLSLNEQLRSAQHANLSRHPLGIRRGESTDSLSNASALRAMEPVSDLLREQLYLQTELGYEGGASAAASSSGHSSRAASPARFSRPPERSLPQRPAVYRATVCLTPALPPRAGAGTPPPENSEEQRQIPATPYSEEREERGAGSDSSLDGHGGRASVDSLLLEEQGGGRGDASSPHLQQLIKEIKASIADEIRQEIVNELLAAVSPRRSPMATRGHPV
ncbi:protein ITPRID2 isoform X2 [Chanos chanos]|uniref:Protein ITPRID2 isoform X2 n=1 Tax=Chanos chanos TaxID=29144 RepID=A0A6J2WCN4_CHACN|nr:protein ITPRID2 isoform X2 [Chanos chanos]